jgi:hypothetical protein
MQRGQSRSGVPKTPKSGAGLERNQVPLSAEITCRFRPKSGAGFLRFLQNSRFPRRILSADGVSGPLFPELGSFVEEPDPIVLLPIPGEAPEGPAPRRRAMASAV